MKKGGKQKMRHYDLAFKRKVLQEADEVQNTSLVAKKYSLAPSTVFTWKRSLQFKDLNGKEKSIRELKKELADKELENQVLKELLKKTYQVWNKE